jgi:hypothetical protein
MNGTPGMGSEQATESSSLNDLAVITMQETWVSAWSSEECSLTASTTRGCRPCWPTLWLVFWFQASRFKILRPKLEVICNRFSFVIVGEISA